jgi:predicted ester cyclase
MSVEQCERLLDQALQALNDRDWDSYGRVFAEALVTQAPGLPAPTKGRAARVHWVQGIIQAFPDGRVEKKQSFGQGDWLCTELAFAGTHTGPLQGPGGSAVPATNRTVRFPYCLVLRLEGAEVTELHEYFDQLELLTQLGLMPGSSAADQVHAG